MKKKKSRKIINLFLLQNMLTAAKRGFKENNSLQENKILVGFLTSQDVFFKLLNKGKKTR